MTAVLTGRLNLQRVQQDLGARTALALAA
jgi:hypothetical protein